MAKKKDKAKRQEKSSAQQSQSTTTKNEKVSTNDIKTKRSKLLLIVGTIIVLFTLAIVSLIGIVVGVRTILDNDDTSESSLESSKDSTENTQAKEDQEDTQEQESISEDASSSNDSDQTQEYESKTGLDNSSAEDTQNEDSSTNEASNVLGVATSSSSTWSANDYKGGDLSKASSYTVVNGDTLWEISEAAYGTGFSWTSILNANSSSVGFLPDGSQALIIPGQVLTIP